MFVTSQTIQQSHPLYKVTGQMGTGVKIKQGSNFALATFISFCMNKSKTMNIFQREWPKNVRHYPDLYN